MSPVLEIVSHPAGPWLVRAGTVQYAVPSRVGKALGPLAGSRPDPKEIRSCLEGVSPPADIKHWVEILDQFLGGEVPRRPARAIRFRFPLLPAAWVGYLAGQLRPWTGNRQLAFLGLTGGAGYLSALAGTGPIGFSPDLGGVIAGLGLFLVSAIWHELGHASALARAGYPPGGIGAGLLFVIPVMYADVTAVGALSRSGRLRVDAAGVIFQLAAGGLMMALAQLSGNHSILVSALTLAGSSILLAVTWSLFPFIRSDGYWLLCDLLELNDLERAPRRPVSRVLRLFLVVYQLANAFFLFLVGLYFPWRMIRLVLAIIHRSGYSLEPVAANWLTAGLVLVMVVVMGPGLARRIGNLVGAAFFGFKVLLIPR